MMAVKRSWNSSKYKILNDYLQQQITAAFYHITQPLTVTQKRRTLYTYVHRPV